MPAGHPLRLVIDDLRRAQVASIQELPEPGDKGKRSVANAIARHVYRAFLDPEAEKARDVWDLAAFGFGGHLSFTRVSQRWLRESVKQWALDDLPKRRGDGARGFVQHHVNCVVMLSDSLRAARDDHGEVPGLSSGAPSPVVSWSLLMITVGASRPAGRPQCGHGQRPSGSLAAKNSVASRMAMFATATLRSPHCACRLVRMSGISIPMGRSSLAACMVPPCGSRCRLPGGFGSTGLA